MSDKIKTIDKLPRSVLIELARTFGHRTPEKEDNWTLADFVSRSI